MHSGLLVFVTLCLVCVVICQPKPIWPQMFDVVFGVSAVNNITANNPSMVNGTSHFYYNWAQYRAQRIDYPAGCIPLFGGAWKAPCSLVFNNNGTYLFAPALGISCCLLLPGIGAIPPNFLAPFNASGFVIPMPDYVGVLHETNFWTTNEGFYYWTDANSGQDIFFTDGSVINWAFVPQFSFTSQSASLYQIPSTCAASCGGTASSPRFHSSEPLIGLSALHYRRNTHAV